VIDDSAIVRQVAVAMLSTEPDFAVEAAHDASIAARKIAKARPDVILLDLTLPGIDGLTFLRQVMRRDPIPVVVVSADADRAIRALDAGALSVVTKPQVDVRGFLEESRDLLVETVRAAAQARLGARTAAARAPAPVRTFRRASRCEVIAIGASTGGPDALQTVLSALPADTPPIAIVQHMPAAFTKAFARRLGQSARLEVVEATDGLQFRRGLAVVAPGNRHLLVERRGTALVARLSDAAPRRRHRPSADVLFESLVAAAHGACAGVLLTGMGDDGAHGLHALRTAGAWTIAQDEQSCVVFGMPKEAIALGAAEEVLGLAEIGPALAAREGDRAAPRAAGN
jgi:two-component system chemotaxis response regulator CheB